MTSDVLRKTTNQVLQEQGHLFSVPPPTWRCPTLTNHHPVPHAWAGHHIWPLGEGGPKKGPLIFICGTCHNDVHVLLARWKAAGGIMPTTLGWNQRVMQIAALGFYAIRDQTVPVLPDWGVRPGG
jgi:hypothetical protein